jgi:hypothetical protein
MNRGLMWTSAGPGLVLAVVSAWWTVGALAGNGLWPPDEVTLSEAVATRNNAEAVRLIEKGANANEPGYVRDGLLTNGYAVTVKPIEAAVGAQRADSLRMLLDNGASVDEEELIVLRCLERARHDSGVNELLAAQSTSAVDCAGVRSPLERVR